jgi:hypothetical protein
MLKLFLLLIVSCSLMSCVSTENVSSQFIARLNDKAKQKNKNLLYDNAYVSEEKKDSLFENRLNDSLVTEPIFFFANGLILMENGQFESSIGLQNWVNKYAHLHYSGNRWGTYSISNDTIRAIVYLGYYKKNVAIGENHLSESHFEGIITENKILNWHLALPLPEAKNKYPVNNDYIERLRKPINLQSINVSSNVDTRRAWINKYKN